MKKTINGAAYRRMILSAAANLELHKQQINELNVFPVPDGDTGTNMCMTICAAANDLKKTDEPDLAKAATTTANAMLRGARGNSGVILSLIFRGFANVFKGAKEADGKKFAAALSNGVEAAYKAVMKPAEGTILTVTRVTAASAAKLSEKDNAFELVLSESLTVCKKAVDETMHQNTVLEKAGVVDAGGMGFFVILEGMLSSLQGKDIECTRSDEVANAQADFSDFATEDIKFGYCTEFIVNRENKKDPEKLRPFLTELGDSLVLVADEEIIKVHVHTNHPGKVIEEALTYGSLTTSKIENMRLQHTEKVMTQSDLKPKPVAAEKSFGVVTVCAGTGLAELFRELGADGVIEGGQTMNPSTDDILKAIYAVPAETVIVLPNNKNIVMAARQAAELSERKVIVIETKTVPEGITAMLNFDGESDADTIEKTMDSVRHNVTTMMITYAARNSDFNGMDIHEGDYLALYNGALNGTDRDEKVLLQALAEKVKEAGKDFITVYYGEGATEASAEQAADIFRTVCPDADVNVIEGGQPVYSYMISAE